MEDATRYHSQVDLSNKNTSHAQLLRLTGRNKKVLEVGPATGYITEVLVQRGCRVTCIEKDAAAAELAERFCERMIVADVEELDFEAAFGEERFEVALLGDVLEHLVDPGGVLVKVARILAPGGYVVASVPNVAHGSVRLALLRGEFRYTEMGLLDRSHLRFFTRETLAEFFRDAGYAIRQWRDIEGDPFGNELGLRAEDFPAGLVQSIRSDRDALAYQFVVKASPSRAKARVRAAHRPGNQGSETQILAGLWRMEEDARQREAAVAERDAVVAERDAARQEGKDLRERLRIRDEELDDALRRLRDIEDSVGWRLLNRIRLAVYRLAPPGSRRYRMLMKIAQRALGVSTGPPDSGRPRQ
ncbi:MAG: class I SAM-dependent methyltransferase [Dehalococcoidia bacterium]